PATRQGGLTGTRRLRRRRSIGFAAGRRPHPLETGTALGTKALFDMVNTTSTRNRPVSSGGSPPSRNRGGISLAAKGLQPGSIRGARASASLKQARRGSAGLVVGSHPRRTRLGLIEAVVSTLAYTASRSPSEAHAPRPH